RHVSRRAEAVQSEASAFFDTRNSQAAEADDSGAEKRSGLLILEVFRNLVYKILPRDGVLRVAAIHGVPSELRVVAEIFHSGAAVFASLIGAMEPCNSHPRTLANSPGTFAGFLDCADDLMPGNHWRFSRRQFAFDYVQIGATDTAKTHADQYFPFSGLRNRDVSKFQRIRFNPRCGPQNARFHFWSLRFSILHLRRR